MKRKNNEKKETVQKGLRCPACGCGHFYVDKTVDIPGRRRRRYKTCRHCGRRVRTMEIIETE
jgi:C4-type Zn-finger protein